jgi:aminoglycoside N3'-acetyltransferase
MRKTSLTDVAASLKEIGITLGDGMLVHSAIQYLGVPVGGVGMYLQALIEAVDGESQKTYGTKPLPREGTIAVPTFNFGFARGEKYDPNSTPSDGMGVFSEYVRTYPGAVRTPHPMQSLAVIGKHAQDLVGRDTLGAFDSGSAFDRMLTLDFKILLLGADIQAVSVLHYCEQRPGVPYRFWKDFQGLVKTPAGWQERIYRMYARDIEVDARIELYPVQHLLKQRGQWRSAKINYGHISTCLMSDFVEAVNEFLERDPWSLVTNPPSKD